MNDSIFIKALYFGSKNPNGFTIKELEEHLGIIESGWGPLHREFEGQKPEHAFNQADGRGSEQLYWLTKSGYELLFELDQVNQASREATYARKLAILSIAIAALVPILTLLIDHMWAESTVLNQEQFYQVIDSIHLQSSTPAK